MLLAEGSGCTRALTSDSTQSIMQDSSHQQMSAERARARGDTGEVHGDRRAESTCTLPEDPQVETTTPEMAGREEREREEGVERGGREMERGREREEGGNRREEGERERERGGQRERGGGKREGEREGRGRERESGFCAM